MSRNNMKPSEYYPCFLLSQAAPLDISQVDIIAKTNATRLFLGIHCKCNFKLGIVPIRDWVQTALSPKPIEESG